MTIQVIKSTFTFLLDFEMKELIKQTQVKNNRFSVIFSEQALIKNQTKS